MNDTANARLYSAAVKIRSNPGCRDGVCRLIRVLPPACHADRANRQVNRQVNRQAGIARHRNIFSTSVTLFSSGYGLTIFKYHHIAKPLPLPAIAMDTLRNLTILFFLTAFNACATQNQDIKAKDFSVSVKSIKGDTIISSVVYYAGHIMCLQDDSKLFVLDTAFNYVDSLTAKFSNLKVQFLHSYNDTILLSTDKDVFYLDTDFLLKKYNNRPFKYGVPYYNDSTYYVHACSAGEWGGSVFFWNKKTNKTFSYPATGVQQVLKFKDNYIVSSFLAHMSGFSDYLFINDPTKLYELKDEKQKTFCNWWSVDSMKNLKLFDAITPQGVKYYADNFTTRTITVFPYNDTLYSIYSTDSATILAKHINFKLVPVDTLLKRRISFQDAVTHLTNNIVVTAYRDSWATIDVNDKIINYQNTGLIFIKGNRICFLEFKTPHMWTESSSR